MKPVKIPRRVDEPPHLLLWSADELAPMLLGLTIGVIIGKAPICFIGGCSLPTCIAGSGTTIRMVTYST